MGDLGYYDEAGRMFYKVILMMILKMMLKMMYDDVLQGQDQGRDEGEGEVVRSLRAGGVCGEAG